MKNENLKTYLNEIQNYPLLSENQEKNLGYLLIKGTERQKKNAARKLVEGNLRLVPFILSKMKDKGYSSELDLIQEGNLGLIHATEKYDVRHDIKFSTYAAYWIRAYINRYIAQDILIRHPLDKTFTQPISLYEGLFNDNSDELIYFVADEKAMNPELEIEKEELTTLCREALNILPYKEKMALTYRYGFDAGGHPRTLKEATELMIPLLKKTVTPQYIDQLCRHAIKLIQGNRDLEKNFKEFMDFT